MNYQKLGKSELIVSEISFGCMSLGNDDEQNKKLLHGALDKGINFFDTADIYSGGQNEITIGKTFFGMRKKIILATKVGNQPRTDGRGLDWNPSRKHILESIEKSLRRLNTDYIDLYQLHGGTINDPIDETIDAFETLKQQGKIRTYGISSIRPNVIREYAKRSHIDSVMMQYSLLYRRPEESCFDLLNQNNIKVLVRGSLAQGLLVNKPVKPYLNRSQKEVEDAVKNIYQLQGRTPVELAIHFSLLPFAVASNVIGIRTSDQLDEIMEAWAKPLLGLEEAVYLQSKFPANFYEQHR
jgi:aryl-alcohol dehydrogenase-like predicted oxidoreductase